MGSYLNAGNEKFYRAINSAIYVDKTELIKYTNKVFNSMQQNICVSRPRRFGKSMAADMLTAYYSRGCDSRALFQGLKIETAKDFLTFLNKYDTISLNIQEFLSQADGIEEVLSLLKKSVLWDILEEYPDFRYFDKENLARTMQDVYRNTGRPFVVIIDEWDCILREYKLDTKAQERYLDFLRDLLKDKSYIQLAYMTGILPIKKYGTHSALNMFDEFSMLNPGPLAAYVGFTQQEVYELCRQYHMDIEEMKTWYDGYSFEEVGAVYSPRSVISSIQFGKYSNYWNQTETFEALKVYIDMNFDGLRDDVLSMMAGERIPVNVGSFTNDMATFHTEDDVLTLLVHLGYLGYDFVHKNVFIPNYEVQSEYVNAVSVSDWGEVSKALQNSADLLEAIWNGREEKVAAHIEQAHFETSHFQYHDENALSYTISLAMYAARNYYTMVREFPSGKGFADMVFIPRRRFPDKLALVVELKWDKSAEGAIAQIKKQQYVKSLEEYRDKILLVGINYDKHTKKHSCVIESREKV